MKCKQLSTLDSVITEKKNKTQEIVLEYREKDLLWKSFDEWSNIYFNAAEYIAMRLFKETRPRINQLDSFFLPMAFLYRHSIELRIKAYMIKKRGIEFTRIQVKDKMHDLDSLVDALKGIVTNQILDLREFQWLEKYIKGVGKLDKKSDSFRYPFRILNSKKLCSVEYVFDKRTDIDLVTMINQFRITGAIIRNIIEEQSICIEACNKISYEFMKNGGGYYESAVLGKGYDVEIMPKYIYGYHNASKILEERSDELIFPICFLKRNTVELQLKYLLLSYNIKMDWQRLIKKMGGMRNKHSLLAFWNMIKESEILSKVISEENSKQIRDNIMQIHTFDPDSSHFRYPANKELKRYEGRYNGHEKMILLDTIIDEINQIDMGLCELYGNSGIPRRNI